MKPVGLAVCLCLWAGAANAEEPADGTAIRRPGLPSPNKIGTSTVPEEVYIQAGSEARPAGSTRVDGDTLRGRPAQPMLETLSFEVPSLFVTV